MSENSSFSPHVITPSEAQAILASRINMEVVRIIEIVNSYLKEIYDGSKVFKVIIHDMYKEGDVRNGIKELVVYRLEEAGWRAAWVCYFKDGNELWHIQLSIPDKKIIEHSDDLEIGEELEVSYGLAGEETDVEDKD